MAGDYAVLNCYRLAKFYSCNPDHFLSLPLDDVARHMMWTDKMLEVIERSRPRKD